MLSKYTIPLGQIMESFSLENIYLVEDAEKIEIKSPEVSRPGLALSGFFDMFEPFRVQVIGKAEKAYLDQLEAGAKVECLRSFFAQKPVAVIITSDIWV